MKEYIRSLIIGFCLLIISLINFVMNSYKIAIFTGILSVVWLVKAFVEWRRDKK